MLVGPRKGLRDNAASVLQQVEDGFQVQESRPDFPRFDPKAPEGAHLFSLRELIKPWRCCYGSLAHSEMITERCRANNELPDGPLILFMEEVQYPPGERRPIEG